MTFLELLYNTAKNVWNSVTLLKVTELHVLIITLIFKMDVVFSFVERTRFKRKNLMQQTRMNVSVLQM